MPLRGHTQGVSSCALNCTISPESQLLTLSLLWRQTPPSRKQGFRLIFTAHAENRPSSGGDEPAPCAPGHCPGRWSRRFTERKCQVGGPPAAEQLFAVFLSRFLVLSPNARQMPVFTISQRAATTPAWFPAVPSLGARTLTVGALTRQRSLWTCPAQDFGSFMLMATASGGCFCLRGHQSSAEHSRSPLPWWDEHSQDGAWMVRRNSSRFHLWCGSGQVPTGLAPLV